MVLFPSDTVRFDVLLVVSWDNYVLAGMLKLAPVWLMTVLGSGPDGVPVRACPFLFGVRLVKYGVTCLSMAVLISGAWTLRSRVTLV